MFYFVILLYTYTQERLSIRERGMMFLGMTSMLKIYSQWPLGLQPYLPKILDCIISLLRSIQAARRGEEVKRKSNCRFES